MPIPSRRRARASLAAVALLAAAPAAAATFDLFEAGTETRLGGFEAPAEGGPVTAFEVLLLDGVFDVLGEGPLGILYRAAEGDLDGIGAALGVAFNSNAFAATTVDGDAVVCNPGDCAFEVDAAFEDGTPGDWGLQFVPPGDPGAAANIATGFYEVRVAPIPLPATGVLLGAGLAGLLVARRRRRAG